MWMQSNIEKTNKEVCREENAYEKWEVDNEGPVAAAHHPCFAISGNYDRLRYSWNAAASDAGPTDTTAGASKLNGHIQF
jgi:hypothetical protein